ncbi:apolipoprotein N-acyltransferase [Actinomadura citrea]|uniref:Apolipoprotein N-acyltransferase n=1 Tax=Actinomadura citrea TaxID=46158 RepID=A0A7Y9GCV5_9ACTN|nr:apolipoprotein N-acyltransferase [Actinomadura citrea]NYE14202.1 apolipoprotein N-acyltransferase [Actinomadura citrea]GGT80191.1 apolipoprotein N-acyltransferase [Actinomadura citrea]
MAQETLPDRSPATGPGDGPGGEPGTGAPRGRLGRLRRGLRSGGRAGWPRTLLAAAAGLVMWPAFPPFDLTPLAPVGVALLTLALLGRSARTAAWLAFVGGAAFFVPALEGISRIGPDGWIILSLVQAAYFLPLGAGIAMVTRLPGWPVWTAALWVGEELIRGRVPFGGFPWARLAFSQTATLLTPYASVGGAPLVTFLTALIGGLLACAAVAVHRARSQSARSEGADADKPPRTRGRALLPAAVCLAAVGAVVGGGLLIPTPADGRPVTVAVVQGNVPRLGLDFLGQRKAVLDNHVKATHELAARVRAGRLARPQLVVWPENASDLDPYAEPDAYNAIDGAVKDIGVPVLVGALTDTPDGEKVENRGIVWDPRTGPGDYYVKRHPVPFGEYLPFRDVLTKLITRFERIPRDFAKGDRSGVMRLGPVDIGDVICFEVAYDKEVRDVARGNLLVVQTNNATYGKTSLPPQQIAMSRLRAVEHGRTILVAATSGISAIVAPDGRMVDRSREFVPAVQVAAVPARTARTASDRLGEAPEWALALLGLGAVCAAAWTARKNEGN